MVEFETLLEERRSITKKICDKCGRITDRDDPFEFQEYHHVRFEGGYGSVFGDESLVEGDFCQHCLKELLGDYLRIED